MGNDCDWSFNKYSRLMIIYACANFIANMAAIIERGKIEGEPFEHALHIVSRFFQVQSFYDEQKNILWEFFLRKSIFSVPVPLLADMLMDQAIGTSIAIIICPLISLMLDQVAYIKLIGLHAAAVYEGLKDIEGWYVFTCIFLRSL